MTRDACRCPIGVAWLITLALLTGLLTGCQRDIAPTVDSRGSVASPPNDDANGPPRSYRSQVERAVAAGDWESAEKLLQQKLVRRPEDVWALQRMGELSARQGDNDRAIALYRQVVDQGGGSQQLFETLGRLSMLSGHPYEAVAMLQQAIERFPRHVQFRFDLTGLASALGLRHVVVEQAKWLHQHQLGDHETLTVLARPHQVRPDGELCRRVLKIAPEDQRAQYGLAKLEAMELKWQAVARRLEPVIKQHPEFLPAWGLYGRALVKTGNEAATVRWAANVPAAARELAEYWVTAGTWAQAQGQTEMAAAAFCRAVRRDHGNSGQTLTPLVGLLKQIDRDQDAELAARRTETLSAMYDATKTLYEREGQSQRAAWDVAEQMQRLGRLWEAEAWGRYALTLPQDPVKDIRRRYVAMRAKLSPGTPWQTRDSMIGQRIAIADLPKMAWQNAPQTESSQEVAEAERAVVGDPPVAARRGQGVPPGEIYRFADQAIDRGIDHVTAIAPDAANEGHWIFQSNGGGAATLDFDRNGWPDLTLAMLNGEPMRDNSDTDRLFRNSNGQFRDVTHSAGLENVGFTQGVTAGDYNDDGFTDLLISNIGRNRLFRNNGDGTFTDVTDATGLRDTLWTTSSAIADINGDGNADLFQTQYCAGDRPYEDPCRSRVTGRLSSCTPVSFDAEPDRVYAGSGDGTFGETTDRWLDRQRPGRGLGLVVAALDDQPGLDVYVANDMSANHLWSSAGRGESFSLRDSGVYRGVALSGQSRSQASMGIALGDPDGDHDMDLFVSHFADEHNTYYEQTSAGLWVDRSYRVGLAEPSMEQLGFGTQWADFDNNGTLELMVTNGHVSDVQRDDVAYRMPTQLFERQTDGKWQEISRKSLGPFFQRKHLGRALITLDADRDGRIDVGLTRLFDPVALLINQSETASPSVGLFLVSTRGHRDAIGAEVTAKIGDRSVYAQLTAGDGYLGTNQKRIAFGVSDPLVAEEIVVRWPSGARQRFGPLGAGANYLLVEGQREAYPLAEHAAGTLR